MKHFDPLRTEISVVVPKIISLNMYVVAAPIYLAEAINVPKLFNLKILSNSMAILQI